MLRANVVQEHWQKNTSVSVAELYNNFTIFLRKLFKRHLSDAAELIRWLAFEIGKMFD